MRRIVALLAAVLMLAAPIASAESIGIASMTFDELVALRDRITEEMMLRDEWQEVTVPAGTYKIGEAIPAGHWVITVPTGTYCFVTIGSKLDSNGKEVSSRCDGYYHIALANRDGDTTPSSVDLDLQDGMYIEIEHSSVIFTPYAGVDFGFSFK